MKNLSDYKTQIEKNDVIAFVPGGNSMWPTLKNRKQSVIVKAKTKRLDKFDVALYVRGQNTFVLHRVMQVVDDGYMMCGDSQFSLEKVKEENVFGVMIGFYRGKKYVDVNDSKYIKNVNDWFGNEKKRKRVLKSFHLREAVKNKLKNAVNKIFKKGKQND